jgi:hypothetical protein
MLNNTEEYSMTRALDIYEEFGVTAQEDAVKTTFTACIKADGNGWFTIDGGNELFAEGSLYFEGKNLVDYGGFYNLPAEIVELLENNGYNCNEI